MSQSIITQGFDTETIVFTTGEIINAYPAPGALGIPIGSNIVVIFDQEMDTTSINSGTFILAAPNTDDIFGPGLESLETIDNVVSLTSQNYVSSTITFYKADEDGEIIEGTIVDTTGNGSLWRTVAVLSPNQILDPNKEYTVILSGDSNQNDNFASGVRTRTVFDPISTVTGTGTMSFIGGYTGSTNKNYVVEIVDPGACGVATYQWWEASSPLVIRSGITTIGNRLLENGVYVSFGADGTFNTGDTWSVLVLPFTSFGSTVSWQFTTGNGSIVVPPSTSSTSGVLTVTNSMSTTNLSGFEVSDITPPPGKYGVEIQDGIYGYNQIIVTFGGTSLVDSDSLIGNISLTAEHALGEDNLHSATGELEFEAVLVDNVLTITIDPGQIQTNNIITLILDRTIENEDGDILGEDFISYFSTTYTPLYTSRRRIALDIGPLIRDIAEEPIMLAILEASVFADALSAGRTIVNTTYFNMARREFTSCYAEYLLVNGMLSGGAGGKLSKKLGSLSISRDGSNSVYDRLKSLEDCFNYWKITIETAGALGPNNSLMPGHSVKGAYANDAIVVARDWEPMSNHSVPAANTWRQNPSGSSRRGFRTFRKR